MFRHLSSLLLPIAVVAVSGCDDPMHTTETVSAQSPPRATQTRQPSTNDSEEPAPTSDESSMSNREAQMLEDDRREEQSPEPSSSPSQSDTDKEQSESNDELSGRVNLNSAPADKLQILPGIGPALAKRIIEYRTERKFRKPSHIQRIKGIGDDTFAELETYLAVSGKTTLTE